MRKLHYIIILLAFPTFLYGQTGLLSGKIFDAETGDVLPFANVFINNTTLGAASDIDGTFEISTIPSGWHEVVFSFVGYKSYQTRVQIKANETNQVLIKLVPDEQQLDVIQVSATRDKSWEKQLARFEKIFLGQDEFALQCKIENAWALDFSEIKRDTEVRFQAKASQPLVINNLALGYKITFFLKEFSAGPQSYKILGNYRFEELKTPDSKMADRWAAGRRAVYFGSDRHLFKSILDDQVKEQGFQLYADKSGFENATTRTTLFSHELGKSLLAYPTKDIVGSGNKEGEYTIDFPARIEIHNLNAIATTRVYRDVPYEVAWIEVRGGQVIVNSDGIPVNTTDIVTSGYMNESRVARMLPFDYRPDQSVTVMREETAALLQASKIARLRELVYLHTDKPYYYPGEVIWFKGYVKYHAPEMMDTLSRVGYVELLDQDRNVVASRVFPVDSGRIIGELALPNTLAPKDYYLRAYTRWMLNYLPTDVFAKPLPIINDTERVRPLKTNADQQISGCKCIISIQTTKDQYQTRERITGTVSITDLEGNSLNANLSISATDTTQVAAVGNEPTISSWFTQRQADKLPSATEYFTHPVEYGISISGQFLNDKSKPTYAVINVVQGNFEEMISVETDAEGKFWLNGFQFMDSAIFVFDAKNAKGKSFGKVVLDKRVSPSRDFVVPSYHIVREQTSNFQRHKIDYLLPAEARLLEEVIVEATKVPMERTRQAITYGEPDYTVKGADLQIASAGNIVPALQGRIPGLQVVPFWDENGFQRYKIRIRGGMSSFGYGGTTEPLLIVDGIPLADGGFIADQLAAINPTSIERIEVITKANPAFGVRGTNGVIAVYTNGSGKLQQLGKDKVLSKKVQSLVVSGYSPAMKFVAPRYDAPNENGADYRSTLYWNPNLELRAANGSGHFDFFAADLPTWYRIVVEGVTQNGETIHAEKFVQIISR